MDERTLDAAVAEEIRHNPTMPASADPARAAGKPDWDAAAREHILAQQRDMLDQIERIIHNAAPAPHGIVAAIEKVLEGR